MAGLAYKGMLPAEKPNTNTTNYSGRRLIATSEWARMEVANRKLWSAYNQGSKMKLEELQAIKSTD